MTDIDKAAMELAERLLYLLPHEPGDQYPEDRATRMANEAILYLRPAVAAEFARLMAEIAHLRGAVEHLGCDRPTECIFPECACSRDASQLEGARAEIERLLAAYRWFYRYPEWVPNMDAHFERINGDMLAVRPLVDAYMEQVRALAQETDNGV